MNHFIQKKLAAFDENFEVKDGSPYGHKQMFPCEGGYCDTSVDEIKTFLSTSIEEAVLLGLRMAEGAIPEIEVDMRTLEGRYNKQFRDKTLSRIAALKKEVMEGRKV